MTVLPALYSSLQLSALRVSCTGPIFGLILRLIFLLISGTEAPLSINALYLYLFILTNVTRVIQIYLYTFIQIVCGEWYSTISTSALLWREFPCFSTLCYSLMHVQFLKACLKFWQNQNIPRVDSILTLRKLLRFVSVQICNINYFLPTLLYFTTIK